MSTSGDEARDPRVYFAAERTLLAWIRTGLALMGFGFVVARFGLFLRELAAVHTSTPPSAASLWMGTALILLGVVVNVVAAIQHARYVGALAAGTALHPRPGRALGIVIALLLAVLGVAMALYLVTTRS